jgi:hypothetical protein
MNIFIFFVNFVSSYARGAHVHRIRSHILLVLFLIGEMIFVMNVCVCHKFGSRTPQLYLENCVKIVVKFLTE